MTDEPIFETVETGIENRSSNIIEGIEISANSLCIISFSFDNM